MIAIGVMDAVAAPDRLSLAQQLSARGRPDRAYAVALEVHEAARCDADAMRQAESADCLADCCIKTAQYELGVGHARTACDLWRALGDDVHEIGAISRLAEILADIGDPDSITFAEQALARAERNGDVVELIRALQVNGIVLTLMRQADQALPFSERAVALARNTGTSFPVAILNLAETIVCAGRQALQGGDAGALPSAVARAMVLTRETLAQARALGDGWLERLALNNIAEYSMDVGDTNTAAAALADYDGAPGEQTSRCRSHHLLVQGRVLAAQGRLQEAVAMFHACRDMSQSVGYIECAAPCLECLAAALEQLGAYQEALTAHRQFHACHVRCASEAAQRRARIYAVRQDVERLREAATESQLIAANLAAGNEVLTLEAERLRRTSLEDPLTGLANRRRLEAEMAMLRQGVDRYAFVMIDIDHFKSVNDRFSHQLGDFVLRKVADVLSASARVDDLVARYGGEEFALIMHETDSSQAGIACERLRQSVQDHDWGSIAQGLSVTVSIGVAVSSEGANREAILAKADQRLYRAKKAGRNKVIVD